MFVSTAGLVQHLGAAGLLRVRGSQGSRVALVFGREVTGLTAEEVGVCSAVCHLPMGRLSESLSLSHAAAIVLSALYEHVQTADAS